MSDAVMSRPDDRLRAMLEEEYRQTSEYRQWQRRAQAATFLTGWMRRVPCVGGLMFTFWGSLIEEGPYQTMKPRWGAITFAYLNDGIRPTAWHTWRQVTHGPEDPYTGIYVNGAPNSLRQAQEWERGWRRDD